jgi:predicted regulator of Ras-like GTPase activity (Roadblock/LC7/MglB family)
MKKFNISPKGLKKAADLEHVKSVFVTTYDGHFIDGLTKQSIDSNLVAEMTANECSSLLRLTSELNLGQIKQLILDCADGKLLVTVTGDFILGVVTTPDLMLGMVRVLIEPLIQEIIIEAEN